jgi:hypothetical protein
MESKSFIIYEADYEMDVISFDYYERYRAKYNNTKEWRACYNENDSIKYKQ